MTRKSNTSLLVILVAITTIVIVAGLVWWQTSNWEQYTRQGRDASKSSLLPIDEEVVNQAKALGEQIHHSQQFISNSVKNVLEEQQEGETTEEVVIDPDVLDELVLTLEQTTTTTSTATTTEQ